ncbi:MAG: response regulator [Chloroflexi bacterium]|nr:response regulator [Chloroflexota bacterium]
MSRKRLLVIEDDPDVAEMLLLYFGAYQYEIIHADSGRAGIEMARARFPHLILLDGMLPDMDGFQVCEAIRQTSFTRYIPILFLTQRDARANKVKGLSLGADDYITKPFDIDELRLRIQATINRATRESLHETRSGLPTGRLIEDEVTRCKALGTPYTQLTFALDNFNPFREVYGFVAADETFAFAARTLQEVLSKQGTADDFVGVNGDHFVVLTHVPEAPALVESVRQHFAEGVKPFYSFHDVEQGGLMLTTAANVAPQHVPLMQLQIEA